MIHVQAAGREQILHPGLRDIERLHSELFLFGEKGLRRISL